MCGSSSANEPVLAIKTCILKQNYIAHMQQWYKQDNERHGVLISNINALILFCGLITTSALLIYARHIVHYPLQLNSIPYRLSELIFEDLQQKVTKLLDSTQGKAWFSLNMQQIYRYIEH